MRFLRGDDGGEDGEDVGRARGGDPDAPRRDLGGDDEPGGVRGRGRRRGEEATLDGREAGRGLDAGERGTTGEEPEVEGLAAEPDRGGGGRGGAGGADAWEWGGWGRVRGGRDPSASDDRRSRSTVDANEKKNGDASNARRPRESGRGAGGERARTARRRHRGPPARYGRSARRALTPARGRGAESDERLITIGDTGRR